MNLDVIHEDDHVIAVNKPAGVVIHPTYKHTAGTLLDALRAYAADWPSSHSPTIVGRLDKLTSGIVIAAKHAEAHAALQRTAMTKEYLAIVEGDVGVDRATIDLPLRVDPTDRRRVIVAASGGKPSVTTFDVLQRGAGLSVLQCRLMTGRRHQIRVHLAARGWPIVGDAVYGRARDGFDRHALHAWRISFMHPIAGGQLHLEAVIPPDFRAIVATMG